MSTLRHLPSWVTDISDGNILVSQSKLFKYNKKNLHSNAHEINKTIELIKFPLLVQTYFYRPTCKHQYAENIVLSLKTKIHFYAYSIVNIRSKMINKCLLLLTNEL